MNFDTFKKKVYDNIKISKTFIFTEAFPNILRTVSACPIFETAQHYISRNQNSGGQIKCLIIRFR